MHPEEDKMPVSTHILGKYKAVADVIYNPLKTKLLREAKAAGCTVASGFEMFVFQGTEQFHIWTGQEPPVEVMRQVVLEKLTSGE
jgi:shikimate 5-dehydrogenase